MSLPVGSEAWLRAWSPPQRAETIRLALRRERSLTAWILAVVAGLAVATATVGAGQPEIDGLPPAPVVPAAVALAVDAVALGVSRTGWRAVARVFAGEAPASALRPLRARTAVAGLVALLVSLAAVLYGGVVPVTALLSGRFGWNDATAAVADALALAGGIAAMRLWVNLLRVRPAPS